MSKQKINGVLKYRKFDGKPFTLEKLVSNKHDALKIANQRRKLGSNARVVKVRTETLLQNNKWLKRPAYAVYSGYSQSRKQPK